MASTSPQQIADQAAFLAAVVGKRIVGVQLATPDNAVPGEIQIQWLELEDGTLVNFNGSGQVDIDAVWAVLGQ